MIMLNSNIIFLYKKEEKTILLLDTTDDSHSIISIHSAIYSNEICLLITNEVSYEDFLSSLEQNAAQEFLIVLKELIKIGFINGTETTLHDKTPLYIGEYFTLQSETIPQDVYATTYYEGQPCGPAGQTYCEPHPTDPHQTTEIWECVVGSPNFWSGMGQSC